MEIMDAVYEQLNPFKKNNIDDSQNISEETDEESEE